MMDYLGIPFPNTDGETEDPSETGPIKTVG